MDFTNNFDENEFIGILGIGSGRFRKSKLKGVGDNIILSRIMLHREAEKWSNGWIEIWTHWEVFLRRNL